METIDKYNYGKSSLRRLQTVSPFLQLAAERALSYSLIDISVPWMGGLRTQEEQHSIYVDGNSKCDGIKDLSYHQMIGVEGKGKALDLVPYVDGGISYEAKGRFGIIGTLMQLAWGELQEEGLIPKDLYLHWGGLWTTKDNDLGWDAAHYEIRDYAQVSKL